LKQDVLQIIFSVIICIRAPYFIEIYRIFPLNTKEILGYRKRIFAFFKFLREN